MFKVTPLRGLTDFDEEQFKRDGIRAHPPITGPNGEYYGHEWSRWRYDTLDQAVDRWLEEQGPSAVLDVGCATGIRASRFALAGHRVTALDVVGMPGGSSSSPIEFVEADVRTIEAARFSIRFDLVHARRLINFLTLDEVDRFFRLVRELMTPGGALAVSLFVTDVGPERMQSRALAGSRSPLPLHPGLVVHHFDEVHGLIDKHGLTIAEAFSDGRVEVGLIARIAETAG